MNRYLKKQKGFIVIPVLVWWILGAVVLTSVVVKEGAISIEYPPKTQENVTINVPTPTPSPALIPTYKPNATPTPKISPQGQVKEVTQNNQNTQTAQGKAGKIVKYKEYCKGGIEISVYESELITKKASDGKTYSMTKDDWNCSDRDSIKAKTINTLSTSANQGTTSSGPTITCVMPYGTFQVPQVHCDNAKAILSNLESIKRDFNEDTERILQESNRKLEEIINRPFQPSNISPEFPTPSPLMIQVAPEPCVVVPPGFGGATSGRVNEAGLPCAN